MTFRLREFIFKQKPRKIIRKQFLYVEDVRFELIQKSVKNINISIIPPYGDVRVTSPLKIDHLKVLGFVRSKLDWIRKHQKKIQQRPRDAVRRFCDGENHLLFGKEYVLRFTAGGKRLVTAVSGNEIILKLPGTGTEADVMSALDGFYRKKLKEIIPEIIAKWQPLMNVAVSSFGIKSMKTRWGTCNIAARRIWLNLELAKRPAECLEYIVVHEMTHLLERNHNKRFHSLMSKFLPDWRERKKLLDGDAAMPVD